MSEEIKNKVAVFVEPTPNPNSLKFIVGRQIARGQHEFSKPEDAKNSPLARKIFEIEGVEGCFIGTDFVSVRKTPEAEWSRIEAQAIETIEEAVASGQPVVVEEADDAAEEAE